jgi:predicted acetyltransferase
MSFSLLLGAATAFRTHAPMRRASLYGERPGAVVASRHELGQCSGTDPQKGSRSAGPLGLTYRVPELSAPVVVVAGSFLTAMREFQAEGRGGPDDNSMIGAEIREWQGRWDTPDGFAAFVAALRAQSEPETPRPAGWVPCTTWWWVDGQDYLGRIALRHQLTERLRANGGHIGYDVRPTARRRGHATAMLRAALPRAHDMDIDPVLVTCDADNLASRKVIEASQGVLEDERHGMLRYWVATH